MNITKKVWLYWHVDKYEELGGEYRVNDSDNYADVFPNDYFLLATAEVEFTDVREVDARGMILDSLKAEKAKIIEKATREAEAIEEKIQQLLALPQGEAA